MPFRLLTVGDGDLSFSLAIKRAFPEISVTASTIVDSPEELVRIYSNSSDIIQEFEKQWKEVIVYGVDATRIEQSFATSRENERFDIVLFNHPHLGSGTLLESEEKHAQRHHMLLAHYFYSAKRALKQNGVVHICLCGNQPQTWDVIGAAKKNGLDCIVQKSADSPISSWLFRDGQEFKLAEVETHYRAKRKFRNGKLGSKHFLSRYGYMHRRTEGELFRGNDREMNVQQSLNFLFAPPTSDASTLEFDGASDDLKCGICKMVFESKHVLERHLDNPALPDIHTGRFVTKIPTGGSAVEENPLQSAKKEQRDEYASIQPINISDATILAEATIEKEFHSTRIKWLCRQHGFPLSKFIKSKRQSEEAIKEGRIFINRQVAMDTGRIVHENDVVSLVEEYVKHNNTKRASTISDDDLASGVRIVKTISAYEGHTDAPSLIVTYKPVGIRCVGQFSSDTLEMIIKKHLEHTHKEEEIHCQPVSKIDTGCAGLCVLRVGGSNIPKITYTFTTLVHGSPDDSWKSGVYVNVPKSSVRNWKRQKNSSDDEATNDSAPTMTQIGLDLDNALLIQCIDSYNIVRDGGVDNVISTLTVRSSHDDGRLANVISFTLRKLGYPVVNDRFAKRESSSLPRRMKNLLKQKVCIGCYRIDICDEVSKYNQAVSIEPHKRTQCKFWKDQLEN